MGDTEGPAVECLKVELEKALNAAKRRPVNVEVEECRKFMNRSEKRISDSELASEVLALDEATACCGCPKCCLRASAGTSASGGGPQSSRDCERNCMGRSPVPVAHSFQSSFAGESGKTSCRSCGVSTHQSTRRVRVVQKNIWSSGTRSSGGQSVNSGVYGFDPARGSAVSQFAVTWLCKDRGASVWLAGLSGGRSSQPWSRQTPSQRRSEQQIHPILWGWTGMGSSAICEHVGEQC